MTNHWNDIDNTSLVFVYGANPAENHPACMAHINAARFGAKKARMIVVDPRLTRTALQCDPNRKKLGSTTVAEPDLYVRIRPGTNVAFTNGLMKWIFDNMSAYDNGTGTVAANMLAWHNGTAAASTNSVDGDPGNNNPLRSTRTFVDDTGATLRPLKDQWQGAYYGAANTVHPLATGYPKYADTRYVVNATGTDYVRDVLHIPASGSTTVSAGGAMSRFPVIADSVLSTVTVGTDTCDTVWTSLTKHLEPYDTATVADICGCSATDIVNVAKALIDNCRFKSSDWDAAQATPQATTYRATTVLYAMGQTQHTNGSQNIKDLAIIQTLMGNMGRPGGGINALRGIHNVQGSTDWGLLYDNIPGYSGNPAALDSYEHYLDTLFGNRMTNSIKTATLKIDTTAANSDVTFTAVKPGAAGNAVSIAYVNGAGPNTPIGVLVTGDAIVVTLAMTSGAVSSTANHVKTAVGDDTDAQALVTTTVEGDGTGLVNAMSAANLAGGYDVDTYHLDASKLGLQQRGFANMTTEWFGNGTSVGADIETLYKAWPKGNGVQHIQTFRNMALASGHADRIISCVVWGQNPAVTEPNQSAVRIGLKALDLMVCVDMFETETAACDRKSDGVTYLIPSCAHVEEAGSVTNSGRWLQWRERACAPKGNSKADLELLFRLAYSLDKTGAFSHLTNRPYDDDGTTDPALGSLWSTLGKKIRGGAYNVLYAAKYGWTPGVSEFEAITATTERWAPGVDAPDLAYTGTGSEIYAERVYEEFARPLNQLASGTASTLTGGTMWIYSGSPAGATSTAASTLGVGGYNGSTDWNINNIPLLTVAAGTATWQVKNRAKSRNNVVKGNDANGANNYPRWGWAWLYNRRVFYNNGEISGDQSDTFVSPGLVSLLFTESAAPNSHLADWSLVYRKYKTFADAPSVATGPHFPEALGGKTLMGRFPGHTEPYESPAVAGNLAFARDYVALFGHNMAGKSRLIVDEVTADDGGTPIGVYGTTSDKFPLVLTSIRCVEHFQGGPITRNNTWNIEAEPVPWIEINSIDAAKYSIVDEQWVNVVTARSNSTDGQMNRTVKAADHPQIGAPTGWARGFKARVGVGLQSNQRVAPGVVAIPWHWGDKGLSTGSRANDLCIDAWDANSQIPEYKACLCQIIGL